MYQLAKAAAGLYLTYYRGAEIVVACEVDEERERDKCGKPGHERVVVAKPTAEVKSQGTA